MVQIDGARLKLDYYSSEACLPKAQVRAGLGGSVAGNALPGRLRGRSRWQRRFRKAGGRPSPRRRQSGGHRSARAIVAAAVATAGAEREQEGKHPQIGRGHSTLVLGASAESSTPAIGSGTRIALRMERCFEMSLRRLSATGRIIAAARVDRALHPGIQMSPVRPVRALPDTGLQYSPAASSRPGPLRIEVVCP
jgi:hypothetical protein